MQITTERHGDIAVIRWANPPLNPLNGALRAGLAQALHQQISDPAVRVVVLGAEGGDFCAGMARDDTAPSLAALCRQIETAQKPVVAALHGAVLGDGLDLALACHYRVGARGMTLGAPGIRVGLLPRGGATQRLPRLVGAGTALALLLSGTPRTPMPGVLDAPLADDAMAAALTLARDPLPVRPTEARHDGFGDPAAFMASVATARATLAQGPLIAPERIIACVEGAILLPFATGLAMEMAAHDDCAASPAAHALSHLAKAEARAWALPEVAGGRAQSVARVAILGGTVRAGELALTCLDAGCEVLLIEADAEGQAVVLERLLGLYDDAVARGTLTAAERDARLLRVHPEATFDDLGRVDLVWEAAPDAPALKRELWSAIGLLARPGALLLASGDVMSPGDLAGVSERSGDLVGLHIPGPAHTAPLAEVRPAPGASPDAVATALAMVRRLQRQAVRGADVPGGLVHHLTEVLQRTIETMLIAGHRGDAIDLALTTYGFRQGPCALLDIRGLDSVLAHRRAVHGHTDPEVALLDALVDSGLRGRGAGAGLLQWGEAGPMGEAPEARALMDALAEAGVAQAAGVLQGQIAEVCAAALANAGAALVARGAVARAGDIDVAAVHALGFPRWRGGPMMAADQRGLVQAEREAALSVAQGAVSPLFADCIKNGTALAQLTAP